MIFYYVILLGLSWPQTKCTENANLKEDHIFDQLATASGTIAHSIKEINPDSDLQEQLSSIPSSIATVHYENSNGFIPMLPSISPSYDDQESSSLQINDLNQDDREETNMTDINAQNASNTKLTKFEEDLTYSSEARIFLNLPESLQNRRVFDSQEKQNDFELLKINNDTPAIANYKDFYENVRNTVNIDSNTPSLGRSNGGRGKRIENYVYNHAHQNNENNPYIQYSQNGMHTKNMYEQEKVSDNYRHQNIANYNGHGHRQNTVAALSLPRTNHGANELSHSSNYDNTAEQSKAHNKFSKPVIVAEPNNYKVKLSSQLRNADSDTDYKTSRNLESSTLETSIHKEIHDTSRQRSYRTEDSKNSSDESMDYEYFERSRSNQRNRKRPSNPDSSRRLPKEHRGSFDNSSEETDKRKYSSLKSNQKPQRYRMKTNPWTNDDGKHHHDESTEDLRHDTRSGETKNFKTQYESKSKNSNSWSQVSPNVEISHSNGIELDQLEKPKFVVPVKVNLVPVANFDHATALGNSQGFDVSNAILQNFVTAAPLGAFSTHAPLLSTPQSILSQNLALSKNLANVQNFVSTPLPDIIVGQNTFQNPLQTVLLSQPNGQNKATGALKTTYLPSTITPVFALTSSLTPTLQSVRLHNAQSNVTPRTALATTPISTPIVQQMPINQVHSGMQQLILPQPTVQTLSNFLQTQVQTNPEYQIQVNPHGLQGQSLLNNGNLQLQSLSTTPTWSTQAIPESRANFGLTEPPKRNTYPTSDTNLLASASLAVQNEHKQASSISPLFLQNSNAHVIKPQENVYQIFKGIDVTPKTKGFIQSSTQVPTILQSNPTLSTTINAQQLLPSQQSLHSSNFILQQPHDHPQQYIKMHNSGGDDVIQQLQLQLNKAQSVKNNRLPSITLQTTDSVVSHSNNLNTLGISSGNAHLPNVGTKNVEILNPNIKPTSIDNTVMSTFDSLRYPAVLTTPIPIFSTITPQTVSLQTYVDSLTETGTKGKHLNTIDLKASQNQERPMFNPSNFVPNVNIIKNQNALNNKPTNEPLQHGLNLVPVMPGGNFFKPSFSAQSELMLKPKLASDLQNYAEEMFKESLKTMYNSQKWNNDRKPYVNGQNISEANDLAKLKSEVQKLRASLSETKYRDILEAHQSENKLHATDIPKFSSSSSDKKKLDPLLATLEDLLKTRPAEHIHIYHGSSRPGRKRKPSGDSDYISGFHDNLNSNAHITEFLTPPRPTSFHVKSPFHNKPMKKRPGSSRYKNGSRLPPRSNNSSPRPTALESSASNLDVHFDRPRFYPRSPYNRDNIKFDPRHQMSFNTHSTFTPSPPDYFNNILQELKESNKDYDINHPRMHNLLGLLMKNKQLPNRNQQNYRNNRDQLKQLLEQRQKQQFYDDILKSYFLDKSDGASQSDAIADRKVYSGNGTT